MYRMATKRMAMELARESMVSGSKLVPRLRPLGAINSNRFSTTADGYSSNQTPFNSHFQSPRFSSEPKGYSSTNEDYERPKLKAQFEDEQARVLQAAVDYIPTLGFSQEALMEGAKKVGLSPAIIGTFPNKEAALLEFFMDDCLQKLMHKIDTEKDLKDLLVVDRIYKLIKYRLELQIPYLRFWPQALNLHAKHVVPFFKQRDMLVNEIAHAVDGKDEHIDWFIKRLVLGAIYSTVELYMLSDSSPGFRDTWQFLYDRVKDAFELEKSFQEAKHLGETVSAGFGSSIQAFAKRILQG